MELVTQFEILLQNFWLRKMIRNSSNNSLHHIFELIYLDVISKWSEIPPSFYAPHI